MAESAETKFGCFRVLEKIRAGTGSQGTVYRAVCEADDYPNCPRGTVVAVKTMPAGADGDRQFEKLKQRTSVLVSINHPNIVTYYGCFAEQSAFSELHVVVEDFLEGESLADRLKAHPSGLDADEALRILSGMVAGLAAAAERGVVHRDVKPANVYLCADGSVKLIDFEVGGQEGEASSTSGNMIGSFDYMAPDFTDPHFAGDERSDIFSAGVVIHEVLSGETPYKRFTRSANQASFAFLDRWSRDRNGVFIKGGCTISSRIERVVAHAKPVLAKALSLKRETRYATFAELKAALRTVRLRDLKSGTRSYRILQLVGKGGFGEVFKARSDGRTYAVKHLLKPDYAARFFREAKIMSELKDPCFVRFFDFFVLEHSGVREAFLVMDFLNGMPGSSLRDAIRRSAGCGLEFASALRAFSRYAHGLRVIHERGIYHRDIKPTNLYYPPDHPELASIMDLGIARDESGTETTGQVPGTLDYMPPETALGGTRGDAAMDLYALGLCLYEALTGKKGFPRLPTGSAAFAQFFKRAKDKARPAFDDERVTSRPGLLSLLVRLTEPDPSQRLSNAGELEQALEALLAGDVGVSDDEAVTAMTTALAVATPADEDDEEKTRETAFVPASNVSEGALKALDRELKGLRFEEPPVWRRTGVLASGCVLLLAAVGAAGFFLRGPLQSWFQEMSGRSSALSVAPAEQVTLKEEEELGIADMYGDDATPIEKIDEMRDRWLAERRPPVLQEREYQRIVSLLEARREQRVIRDRLAADRSRLEGDAKAVVETYRRDGIAAGDERRAAWQETWKGASKARVAAAQRSFDAARAERRKFDAAKALVPRAEAAAKKVARSYEANGLKIADKERNVWKGDWCDRLLSEDLKRLDDVIGAARNDFLAKAAAAEREAAGRALVAECEALISLLAPVDARANRLTEAESKVGRGKEQGLIDGKTAGRLLKQVAAARTWTVFEIENQSDLDLQVGGVSLQRGATHVFVYTNAPPADLSASCVGRESYALGRQSDGRRIQLLPEHFTLLKVPVSTGTLPADIGCRIDGVSVRSGILKLLPGSHECIYTRPDYKSQSLPFRLEPGVAATLPPPGKWVRSDDWIQRNRDKQRAERSRKLQAECEALLADEPIATRFDRLKTCGSRLREWSTPDTLGEALLKSFQSRLRTAETLGVGAVVNVSGSELLVIVGGVTNAVPDGARKLLTYPLAQKPEAVSSRVGYETIGFPEPFAGMEFKVTADMLRPLPVKVTLPALADDMTCEIDGQRAARFVEIMPGDHVCVFRRPDYFDMQHGFTVSVGEPLTLPTPDVWREKDVLKQLVAAEVAADSGDWNQAKALADAAAVQGAPAVRRKLALCLRIEQSKRFRSRLDAATAAHLEERWTDVIKLYGELKLEGYGLIEADRKRVVLACENVRRSLEMRERTVTDDLSSAARKKLKADREWFQAMARLLECGEPAS